MLKQRYDELSNEISECKDETKKADLVKQREHIDTKLKEAASTLANVFFQKKKSKLNID